MTKKKEVWLRCPRTGCEYAWQYRGNAKKEYNRVSCPMCGTSVKVGKNRLPGKPDDKP